MGQSIRFSEKDVRDMGRAAGGVTGIKLSKGNDKVVGSVIVIKNSKKIDLLVVSDKGYGKRTKTSEYKTQNRAGSGILTYKVTDKTGHLVSARSVCSDVASDVLLATSSGKVLRIAAKNVPVLGRATQGVRLIKLDSSDTLISAALMEQELEETEE
jgi:DNA gyrase subunit A